jgi:hypothetical protein
MDNGLAALKASAVAVNIAPVNTAAVNTPVNTESNKPESNAPESNNSTRPRTSASTCASAERRLHPSGQHAHAHQRPRPRQCAALHVVPSIVS